MFYSSSEVVKNLYSSEEKYENLKKIFLLIEKAPARGDLVMPFIAISLKKIN